MRLLARSALALTVSMLMLGLTAAHAQEPLMRRDDQERVTVTVTLLAPTASGTPLKAKVVLDTHSVSLDGVAFEDAVVLRTADGADVAPTTVEQGTGSGHHREAVVAFPPLADGAINVVVKGVGGVKERLFSWVPGGGR